MRLARRIGQTRSSRFVQCDDGFDGDGTHGRSGRIEEDRRSDVSNCDRDSHQCRFWCGDQSRRFGGRGEPLTPIVLKYANTNSPAVNRVRPRVRGLSQNSPHRSLPCKHWLSGAEGSESQPTHHQSLAVYGPKCKPLSQRNGFRSPNGHSPDSEISECETSRPIPRSPVQTDTTDNRISAIAILADLVDDDNRAVIKKTVEAMRFDAVPAFVKPLQSEMEKWKK